MIFSDIFVYSLVRLWELMLRFLPEGLAKRALWWMVGLLRLILPKYDKVAERNLKLVFGDIPPEKIREIKDRSISYLIDNFLVLLRISRIGSEWFEKNVDMEAARALMQRIASESPQKGAVLATLHFGPFELLLHSMNILGYPVDALARGFGLTWVDGFVSARRATFGARTVGRKGGYKGILQSIESGRSIAVLADQNVKRNHAVFVDFFGRQAATTRSVALAAIQTGCPIIVGALVDRGECYTGKRYKIHGVWLGYAKDYPGDRNEKVQSITQAINDEFEKLITAFPDHWFWIHRRFKTKPLGVAEDTYANL